MRVNKLLGIFLCGGFLFKAGLAWAGRAGDQGYGLMIGNPSGISAKYWLNDTFALDAAVGAARSEFDIHATLLMHNFNWNDKWGWFPALTEKGEMPVYVGVGPRLLLEEDEELGMRFPAGVSFLPNNSPWEVFAELAPVLRLTPSVGFNGDFSLGFRYYFTSIKPQVKN